MKKRKTKGSVLEIIVGGFVKLIGAILKLLAKAIVMLGLWVPLLYILFGIILHYTMGFEPFDFSMFSTFYIVGGIVCIVIVVIISAYNLFINPIKKARTKKEEKRQASETEGLQPPLTEEKKSRGLFRKKSDPALRAADQTDVSDMQSMDWMPSQRNIGDEPVVAGEKPQVYFSTLKPDILVHEYSNRFELFRVEGNKLVSIGTEYK